MDILEHRRTGFVVNVGASDGNDVCDAFFQRGFDGVCIEPIDVHKAADYVKRLPGKVKLDTRFATPSTIDGKIGRAHV